jgi:hypothetical protein
MSSLGDLALTTIAVARRDPETNKLLGTYQVPGRIVGPGIAITDVRDQDWTTFHYAVVHLPSGRALITIDLCEECALAAAEKVLTHGGWERTEDEVRDDPQAWEHVQACEIYGPCYPPEGLNLPFKMKVFGHVPGQPLELPEGIPANSGVLVPEEATDEEIEMMLGALRQPWYERDR